jgi:hypothetical protein
MKGHTDRWHIIQGDAKFGFLWHKSLRIWLKISGQKCKLQVILPPLSGA